MRKKGFTLIELLVVIAIIVLLVSILVPSLNYARELARRAACAANFSAIGKAFAMYSASHNDAWPQVNASFDVATSIGAGLTAGGDAMSDFSASTCPIEQLNPLVEEGHCQYKAFLCPSAGTGDAPQGQGSNEDYGFLMYPDGDSANAAKYFVDYGVHLGWGGDASFRTLSDADVIMADLTWNGQTNPASGSVGSEVTDSYSNHKDSGLNMLNKNGSVTWKEPEEISSKDYPIYNQDNIYTNGTTISGTTTTYQKTGGSVNTAPTSSKDMVLWIHGAP